MVACSILDLVRIRAGHDAKDALDGARTVAQHAERLGYLRFWMAEHHNMPGTASAATAVAIAHVAAGTRSIRIGAGGVMLPNHSPLVVAEQFGTLAALFPGRIDLGLGRATGGDLITQIALRRSPESAGRFPQDVLELQALLAPTSAGQRLRATPGEGSEVPLWILGSSQFGARLAAEFGLPYAFASHFAPAGLPLALWTYRDAFKPSSKLPRPWTAISVNVVAGKDDQHARRLATTQQISVTDILRGQLGPSRPAIDDIDSYWTSAERGQAAQFLAGSIIGGPSTVAEGLQSLARETAADEFLIVSDIYDEPDRIRSFEIIAAAFAERQAVAA